MRNRLLTTIIAITLVATAATAQTTAAEQLQRAIFAQDSQGNLDSAIAIYRQLVAAPFTPRDTAAHAQYKLTQALMQKGDTAGAARELERMQKDFSEYRELISGLAATVRRPAGATAGAATAHPAGGKIPDDLKLESFDFGAAVTIRGNVAEFLYGPTSYIVVAQSPTQRYIVLLAASTLLQRGTPPLGRNAFKLGDAVSVDARAGNQGAVMVHGMEAVRGQFITGSDGKVVFNRATLPTQ